MAGKLRSRAIFWDRARRTKLPASRRWRTSSLVIRRSRSTWRQEARVRSWPSSRSRRWTAARRCWRTTVSWVCVMCPCRSRCQVAYRCRILRPSTVAWEVTSSFTSRSRRTICSSRCGCARRPCLPGVRPGPRGSRADARKQDPTGRWTRCPWRAGASLCRRARCRSGRRGGPAVRRRCSGPGACRSHRIGEGRPRGVDIVGDGGDRARHLAAGDVTFPGPLGAAPPLSDRNGRRRPVGRSESDARRIASTPGSRGHLLRPSASPSR